MIREMWMKFWIHLNPTHFVVVLLRQTLLGYTFNLINNKLIFTEAIAKPQS